MKKLIIFLYFMLLMAPAPAQDYTFKKDSYDENKTNISDANGTTIGYFKTDPYDKDKLNLYLDQWGKTKTFSMKELQEMSRIEMPNVGGTLLDNMKFTEDKGMSFADFFMAIKQAKDKKKMQTSSNSRVNYKDENGNIVGYSDKDPLRDNLWNVYNTQGKQVGYYRINQTTGKTEVFSGIFK